MCNDDRATCRVPESTTNSIDRAYEQDGNFHDRLREVYKIAMHPPRQEALRWAHMHTLLFTVANSPQTAADQHN